MSYTREEIEKELKYEKMSLHIKYISGISFACVCAVIVLKCCDGSTFQNCISVSSTVVSIILSVIAIILSVTGERSTNEIRNKISDIVDRLTSTTDKTEKTNMVFDEVSSKQIKEFEKISNKLEELVEQLNGIENNTINTKEMLATMITLNQNEVDSGEGINKAAEYVSALRKKYTFGNSRYLLDRTIAYVVKMNTQNDGQLDEKFIEYLSEYMERTNVDIKERNVWQSVYLTVAMCLLVFSYSEEDKQCILEEVKETESMY